jgi:Uma2 family endonuclease
MASVAEKKRRKEIIPSFLVYEELDGKPVYRKGYKEVLAKTKTFEEIMGSSVLQALIISAVAGYIKQQLPKKYAVVFGEAGLHLAKGSNLANNIAVYEKKDILNPLSENYFDVAAQLVIEVDIKAETGHFATENDYIYQKTTKMLDLGIPKVIWITTQSRKLLLAEPGKDWIVADWSREVELMEGLRLNLEALLKEESVL